MDDLNDTLRPEYDLSKMRIRKIGPARRSFRGVPNPDYDPQYDYLYADKGSQTPIRPLMRDKYPTLNPNGCAITVHHADGTSTRTVYPPGTSAFSPPVAPPAATADVPKQLQITPEEEAQAFSLLRFVSGDVVVSYLGDNDRLLKTVTDAGDVAYVHQRLGRLSHETAHDKPGWHTVFAPDTGSPKDAVDRGEQRLGKDGIVAVIME